MIEIGNGGFRAGTKPPLRDCVICQNKGGNGRRRHGETLLQSRIVPLYDMILPFG